MKLKAYSEMFRYDSPFWTSSTTYNPLETFARDSDHKDAKLPSFNTHSFSNLIICYRTLSNCYTYDLGFETLSARELFSGDYRESLDLGGAGRRAFTDLFLPPAHPDHSTFWNGTWGNGCKEEKMKPGINTQNGPHIKARIGYAVGRPTDPCDDGNLYGTIGIGLIGKSWHFGHSINAPYTRNTVRKDTIRPGDPSTGSPVYQAWLFGA